jgi:hypothetical protein
MCNHVIITDTVGIQGANSRTRITKIREMQGLKDYTETRF